MRRFFVQSFARLVGLVSTLFGVWILIVNLPGESYAGWVLAWILSAGFVGAIGGLAFLLSLDGPERFRTRPVRLLGWAGMLYLAMLPWSFQIVMLILVALAYPIAQQRQAAVQETPAPTT